MMKIALQVNGREMTFSERELSSILGEYFSSKEAMTAKVGQWPSQGKWFEVKPQSIDKRLFEEKRQNKLQEDTRKLILEAFEELQRKPEKYGKNFKTMFPKKTWYSEMPTIAQLKEMASNLGDHNADWVELALEWAQLIANGRSWETVCNEIDTQDDFRLVIWKDGYMRHVGGKYHRDFYIPGTYVSESVLYDSDHCITGVPLVVSYE